jgi:serine O-acetyltransferase
LLRAPFRLLYACLKLGVQFLGGIEISPGTRLGRRVVIYHSGGIVLAARSIGDDVVIRQNTTLGEARYRSDKYPVIGDRVDIGCGACILGDIQVGHDSVIGANAVVLKDVPPYSVAVGVPARVVKTVKAPAPPERSESAPDRCV